MHKEDPAKDEKKQYEMRSANELNTAELQSIHHKQINYIKNGSYQLDPYKANPAGTSTKHYIAHNRVSGVILFPSFCTPLVVEPNSDLSIFMLINTELAENYTVGELYNTPLGPVSKLFMRRVNLHLRYNLWAERKLAPLDFKNPRLANKTLYDLSPVEQDLSIIATKPELVTLGVNLVLRTENNKILGIIKASVIENYLQHGLTYLTMIKLKKPAFVKNCGLYNLSFIALANQDLKSTERGALYPLEELEDRILINYLNDKHCKIKHPYSIKEPFEFLPALNDTLQSYHPVYVVDKTTLGLGHITDLHVSSRQAAFKLSKLQVILDAPQDVSPFLGTLTHSCFESLKSLLDQMGKNNEVDLLFITGDLVDFSLNLSPEFIKKSEDYLELWHLMHVNELCTTKTGAWLKDKLYGKRFEHALDKIYTKFIDNILIYSLILYYYDTYKKPVFFTTGNHDSYEYPYGISPRLMGVKANAGIPMDHNLTYYEAILLYGPGYKDIMSCANFKNDNVVFFHHLFTPFTDFTVYYKEHIIIGLDWGGSEAIAASTLAGRGTLPRANDGLKSEQMALIAGAVNDKRQGFLLIFAHAPIINYDNIIPLLQANTELLLNADEIKFGTKYDRGSYEDKGVILRKYLIKNLVTHYISGHSHRNALYYCHALETLGEEYNQRGELNKLDTAYKLRGLAITNTSKRALNEYIDISKTRFIVSGAAGPIGNANHYGEFAGCALDIPCGNVVVLENNIDYIYKVNANSSRSKPRFAVMMDYFDIEYQPILKKVTCIDSVNAVYRIEINEKFAFPIGTGKFKVFDFLQKLCFYVIGTDNKLIKLDCIINSKSLDNNKNLSYVITICAGQEFYKSVKIDKKRQIFLVLFLHAPAEFSSIEQIYDFSTPWIMRVEILEARRLKYISSFYRHTNWGEVPNLREYEELKYMKIKETNKHV